MFKESCIMERKTEINSLITAALFIAAAPHFTRLPIWVTVWCLLFWGFGILRDRSGWRFPSKTVLPLFSVCGFAAILLWFGFPFEREAGVALLSLTSSIKPMETVSFRDRMVAIFLAYFLTLTTLLFSTSLLMTFYMFFSVAISTGVLIRINHPEGKFAEGVRLAFALTLQALPLTLLLFFLFPRIQGSLWGVTKTASGRTGLSETLTPGAFATLVPDRSVAFRVKFEGDVPAPALRYWRAIVFQHYDGVSWRPEKGAKGNATPRKALPRAASLREVRHLGGNVQYEVTLEPHGKKWLFALDLPTDAPAGNIMDANFTIAARKPVRKRLQYSLLSATRYHTGPFPPGKEAYHLPSTVNPDARKLAERWAAESKDPETTVRTAMDFFRNGGFFYSLRPPPLGADPIDDFLFDKKTGYCGHYASAFAFLMRAAGLPARIVGGYLGGELNPFGDYLIVRQSEAHAWVEVWISGRGWRRIDPTSVVVPDRADRGATATLPPGETEGFTLLSGSTLGGYLRRFVLSWDAVNHRWNRWVIGYSSKRQRSLLKRFGIEGFSLKGQLELLFLFLAGACPFLVAVYLWVFRAKGTEKEDPAFQCYLSFCRKLARIGLERGMSEGPLDYAERVNIKRPDLTDEVDSITILYIDIRYGNREEVLGLKHLEARVKRFHPPPG